MLASLPVPDALIPRDVNGNIIITSASSTIVPSVNPAVTGRRENQGIEGLSISPDGKKLFALLQSATLQGAPSANSQTWRRNTRMLVCDISKDPAAPTLSAEYALQLPTFTTNGSGAALNRTAAQSEMLAINDRQMLVLVRDGNGYSPRWAGCSGDLTNPAQTGKGGDQAELVTPRCGTRPTRC